MSATSTSGDKKLFPFLDEGGEMGKLMEAYDWEGTSLGKIEEWPISLRTTVGTMLHAKYPMFLFWGQDHISFYNDAFIPSFGIDGKHPSALGKSGEKFWAHTWSVTKSKIDLILNGSESMHGSLEVPIVRNGMFHNVNWTFGYSAVRNDEGHIEGVLISCNETVNESLAKLNLEESRIQLAFAIDTAEMATFDYNPITKKYTGNDRLREWFQVANDGEVELSRAIESIIEQDRERVRVAIADSFLYENGGKYEIEYTIKNPNSKEERVVMAKGKTYFDENRQVYKFNGILIDISKHSLAERRIRESEDSFKLLTQALPHLVWVTDQQGKQIYVSNSWNEYTGLDQISEDDWDKIVHPDDLRVTNSKWQRCLRENITYTNEVRLKRKDGAYRWHKVEGVPLKNECNEAVRWIGAFSDIHELRLREAQKDEFISIASHEMRTPLTSAKGYIELLLLTMPSDDASCLLYANKASEALSRLQSFITELLDVSKMQNGKITYNFEQFDFIGFLKDTVNNMQLTASKHTIEIIAKEALEIRGDKLRLMQVIINLLSNAIKYSPDANSVKVLVSDDDETLQVCVMDYGVGMAERHLKKVFNRYYRVEEHAVHFQGLGIGLYISCEIVIRHQGKMWVESEVGKGSKFYFSVPINQH